MNETALRTVAARYANEYGNKKVERLLSIGQAGNAQAFLAGVITELSDRQRITTQEASDAFAQIGITGSELARLVRAQTNRVRR